MPDGIAFPHRNLLRLGRSGLFGKQPDESLGPVTRRIRPEPDKARVAQLAPSGTDHGSRPARGPDEEHSLDWRPRHQSGNHRVRQSSRAAIALAPADANEALVALPIEEPLEQMAAQLPATASMLPLFGLLGGVSLLLGGLLSVIRYRRH